MTIAIATEHVEPAAPGDGPRLGHRRLKRILIATGAALVALILLAAGWVGLSLYRIDHAVHHVGVPASLLAKGPARCAKKFGEEAVEIREMREAGRGGTDCGCGGGATGGKTGEVIG